MSDHNITSINAAIIATDPVNNLRTMTRDGETKVQDWARLIEHDLNELQKIVTRINEGSSVHAVIANGALSVTCSDLIYYADKLRQQALCLETLERILELHKTNQDYKNDRDRIQGAKSST